jgi:molybdate transport system substrate-binding protein
MPGSPAALRACKLAYASALFCALVGCSKSPFAKQDIDVFAAASLKESFAQISAAFEKANPGAHVVLSFAGSQQLALQINKGAPCAVFASADAKQMRTAEQKGRILPGSVLDFASNRLVIVATPSSKVHTVDDLAKPGIKVVIADAKVPAGSYTVQMLEKAKPGFKKAVMGNVVSFEQDVRAVLTKVQLGEADAGVVYATDAMTAKNLREIELPKELSTSSVYYIAALQDAQGDLGSKFVAFVMSPQGQKVFKDDGFLTPTK